MSLWRGKMEESQLYGVMNFMKQGEEKESFMKHIDQRFDQLDKLVTLSLLSDVIKEYDHIFNSELSAEVVESIEQNCFCVRKTEIFGGKIAIYIESSQKIGLTEIREMKKFIEEKDENLIIVFVVEKINGNQRKKMLEERISFLVGEKELYISE